MHNVNDVVHFYIINVLTKYGNGTLVEKYKWQGLRWELRNKYDWYFKYRAALLQVKYPKYYIETRWGHEPAVGKTKLQLLAQKLITAKSKHTKASNLLKTAEEKWNYLFPIQDDKDYIRATEKVNRLKFELQAIQIEFNTLKNQS